MKDDAWGFGCGVTLAVGFCVLIYLAGAAIFNRVPGRYQHFKANDNSTFGERTLRLDTSTGRVCVLQWVGMNVEPAFRPVPIWICDGAPGPKP